MTLILKGLLFVLKLLVRIGESILLEPQPIMFGGISRSPLWNRVRGEHLKKHPSCAICGSKEGVQVHHKKPFHLYPELELVGDNLVTLCERSGANHHLIFGHLGDFSSWNPNVDVDVLIWREKFKKRPYLKTL